MRIELDMGRVLYSQDELEKRRCKDVDESNKIDLSQAPYWLIDSNCDVMPIHTIDDLANELAHIEQLKKICDELSDERLDDNKDCENRKKLVQLGPLAIYDELGGKE